MKDSELSFLRDDGDIYPNENIFFLKKFVS